MAERMIIKNGSVILRDRIVCGKDVLIRGHKIASVGVKTGKKQASVIDAFGHYVSPGFIDTHIHGNPHKILENEIRHGTTSIVVTESCAPIGGIYKKAGQLRRFIKENPLGPSVLGLRIEGPYISMIKAGAQDGHFIRRPNNEELMNTIKYCSPVLRMMTIAPEEKGALPLVRTLVRNGILASVGHSYATYKEAKNGISAGIRHATHVFNAMRDMNSSEPGVMGAILSDDRIFAEIILDFVHVKAALFGLLIYAKGIDRVVLVTDSVRALKQKGVKHSRGAYRFASGKLAGSSLTMIAAVKNAVACGIKLPEAVQLATINPARLLGVAAEKGSIETGKYADIVIFDKYFNVKMTIVRGKIIYRTGGF